MQHTLPSGSVTNPNEYKIQVTIWNEADSSISSDYEVFQTSSRPVVTVDPIGTVGNQSYNFTAQYFQAESEPLSYWYVFLYNSNQVKIAESGQQTSSSLQYLFEGLQSGKIYYIEFQATSSKGLVGTSGLVQFDVLYTQPVVNVFLTAENYENASIKLSWHVIRILGIANPDPPTYINNEKIDLTQDGSYVYFDEGFSVDHDFTLKVWLENPKNKEDLLVIKGKNGIIKLQYWALDERFHLFKTINDVVNYTTSYVSNVVNSGNYFVCIQQIGDLCNITAEDIVV